MGVKVATACLQWSQPIVPQSPSSPQTLASAISSPSSKRRTRSDVGPLLCRYVQSLERSAMLPGAPSTKVHRFRSSEYPKQRARNVKRACAASLDAFSDEEFSRKIQELALRFQLSDDYSNEDENRNKGYSADAEMESVSGHGGENEEISSCMTSGVNFEADTMRPPPSEIEYIEPPWRNEVMNRDSLDYRGDSIAANIERKANSVDLPVSLRMIKRKMQWKEGFREAGESAYCSVKKAFSSMVFIIRELHSFALQMREVLFYEDLQGILVRVQREMHASFVWLFQQIFSHTPTLMVYVMILLANFTVYSMGSNAAIAVAAPASCAAATEIGSVVEAQDGNDNQQQKFDSSSIKTYSISSSSGKSTSIGGNNGGGGKVRSVASGTDGDGQFHRPDQYRPILPDGAFQLSSFGTTREAESVSEQVMGGEELSLWNSIVEEASNMQASSRDESLDHDTIQRFVSPVTARIEADDDYADYFRTELLYQTGLSQDPNSALLLANYAQFLYLVAHDYDRAETYFKKAVAVEPPDAEAYNKYASFLWRVRNDLWAAEETFLEAISADPTNSFYAANYAHFLWNTGGEDTCFPLSAPDQTNCDAQES